MGRNPRLGEIEKLLACGDDFELTDAQYEKKTGVQLPKEKSYLRNRSALAVLASQNGYHLEVVEKTVKFIKTKERT